MDASSGQVTSSIEYFQCKCLALHKHIFDKGTVLCLSLPVGWNETIVSLFWPYRSTAQCHFTPC